VDSPNTRQRGVTSSEAAAAVWAINRRRDAGWPVDAHKSQAASVEGFGLVGWLLIINSSFACLKAK